MPFSCKNGLQSGYFFSHCIQGDAISTADVPFADIVFPWTEDKYATIGDSIEDIAGWLVVVAEAVISEDDERMLLGEEDSLYFFLFGRDEG